MQYAFSITEDRMRGGVSEAVRVSAALYIYL